MRGEQFFSQMFIYLFNPNPFFYFFYTKHFLKYIFFMDAEGSLPTPKVCRS